MKLNEPIIYMVKRHKKYDAYLAVVLQLQTRTAITEMSCETIDEVIQNVTKSYGQQIRQVSVEEFEQIYQQCTSHSPEMQEFLRTSVMGDLRNYYVYGSYRSIGAAHTRIPNAVYLPVPNWKRYGFCMYVVTPLQIEEAVQASCALTFVSRPVIAVQNQESQCNG